MDRHYLVKSTDAPLLMGDVMAVLAECQNRQERGLDRWAGVLHYTGQLEVWSAAQQEDWDPLGWRANLEQMDGSFSIKVVVSMPFASGEFPAFSMRRVDKREQGGKGSEGEGEGFLHELVVHEMIRADGLEHRGEGKRRGYAVVGSVCEQGGPYRANLVAVRGYEGGYLWNCRHVYRLLADVEKLD